MDQTIYYRSKSRGFSRNTLLIVFTCCFLLCSKIVDSQIRILFVGDILLSRNVKSEMQSRHTFPWEKLKSEFHSADLVLGNLEGAVGKVQDQTFSNSGSPVFAIDAFNIGLLGKAGFNAITVENNHSLDLGSEGKKNTIKELQKSGITPVSFENSPQFFKVKDTIVALLAINIVMGRDGIKPQLPLIEVSQKLRLARSLAKIVIVSIHWGSELLEWPNREQRETAKWLIKKGVDVIIGSHPHVVQKPEIIDGKPVFFSLGNHLFDQKYPETKEGLMVQLIIRNGKFSCEGIFTHTQPNSFYPEITRRTIFGLEPVKLTNPDFRINNYTIKPLSFHDSIGNKVVLQAFENKRKVWETHPMTIISIATFKPDNKSDYLFMLEKHYSSLDNEINLRPYVYRVGQNGLSARWRGSALAWPILDAKISPDDNKILCVMHRGDSFIKLDKTNSTRRFVAYKWNGFGFSGISDSTICVNCEKVFDN
ncbi:MAG: CapA family protein [Bacteroidota bacterium]|nr:CapA family protein [Bacteroidota bacterium]